MMTQKMLDFFSGCRNPIAVSDLITSLAAGNQLQVRNIPNELLPAVVLLATIGLREFEQQIIDDYESLLAQFEAVIKDPQFSHSMFWHPQLSVACKIVDRGARGEYTLNELPDCGYMFDVYETLVNADLEELTGDVA